MKLKQKENPTILTQIKFLDSEISKLDDWFWTNYINAKNDDGKPISEKDAKDFHNRFVNLKLFLCHMSESTKHPKTQQIINEEYSNILIQIKVIKNWLKDIGIPMPENNIISLESFKR